MLLLEDVSSQNGTWVGSERLRPLEPRPLQDGDLIGFGLSPAAAPAVMERLAKQVKRPPQPSACLAKVIHPC